MVRAHARATFCQWLGLLACVPSKPDSDTPTQHEHLHVIASNCTTLIDGFANHVHDTAKGSVTDWDTDGVTSVSDWLTTDETFSTVHGNGTDSVLSQMLGDFQDETDRVILNLEGVENRWEWAIELNIDNGTNDGGHLASGGSGWGRGGEAT
jgi:hypothetical protein